MSEKENKCEARMVFYCNVESWESCKYYQKTMAHGFEYCEHVSSAFCRCREANRDAYMAALKKSKERGQYGVI